MLERRTKNELYNNPLRLFLPSHNNTYLNPHHESVSAELAKCAAWNVHIKSHKYKSCTESCITQVTSLHSKMKFVHWFATANNIMLFTQSGWQAMIWFYSSVFSMGTSDKQRSEQCNKKWRREVRRMTEISSSVSIKHFYQPICQLQIFCYFLKKEKKSDSRKQTYLIFISHRYTW